MMRLKNFLEMVRRASVTIVAVTVLVFSLAPMAKAEFPEKPVEMTLLFGGPANVIGQLLSEAMAQNLGQPVVAVSRTGGGGGVGYTYVHGTNPDGYNVVFNSSSISVASHRGNIPFGYEAFDAIAQVGIEVPALGVSSKRGWKTLDDLVKEVKSSKGKFKVGISGKGSFTHLASAVLFEKMGIVDKVLYVPYGRGKAPAELMAGRVDAALQWPAQFTSYVTAGKLNILAVTSAERTALLPDTPTAKEQGYDIDIIIWRGLAAPLGTPKDRILRLQEAVKAAVMSDNFKKVSKEIGFTPAYLSADDFQAQVKAEDERIKGLVVTLGLEKK